MLLTQIQEVEEKNQAMGNDIETSETLWSALVFHRFK
jgi:hypothetical protein